MLAAFIFWIYTLVILYIYGWITSRILSRLFHLNEEVPHISILVLVGLCTVTTLGAFLSLIMPLSWLAQLLLFGGAVIICLWRYRRGILPNRQVTRGEYPLKPAGWLLLVMIIFSALLLSIVIPGNPDTGIYHAQAIRWIESYPAVPGLGNIHTRLAYNSNWLLVNALFSFSFLGLRSFHLMGSVVFVAGLWYFSGGINRLLHGKARPSDLVRMMLIPMAFLILGSEVSSPGTDLPAAILVWIFITEAMTCIEEKQATHSIRPVLLVYIATYALTVKLANAPILLLGGYLLIMWVRQKQMNRVLALIGLVGWIVLPWLTRNVILSGYLIFPYPEIDLFNFDWKVPAQIASLDQDTIRAWALPRLTGQSDADILAMSMRRWVPYWFEYLTINRKAIITVIVMSPLMYVLVMLINRKMGELLYNALKAYVWIYVVAYTGVLFWFLTAPLFRYGYNFTISTFALAVLPFLLLVSNWINLNGRWIRLFVVSVIVVFQGWVLYNVSDLQIMRENAVLPADYPIVSTKPCELRNTTMLCAESWDACWYDVFPCVPFADPMVKMRGDDLREGFKYVSLSEEEQ